MMKEIFAPFLFVAALAACNSAPQKQAEKETATVHEPAVEHLENTETNFIEINTDEALLATALLAAPAESREECSVIGYNMAGEFVTFKEGTNEFICLADDPTKEGFSAACYHKSLEPFMARGRALKAEGKSHQEIFDIREKEAKAGELALGEMGATLHIYYGKDAKYNPKNGQVLGANYRYVVYMPWATSASTGLPEAPVAPNHPWIMNPGTHRAHIMITPLSEAD